MDVLVNFALVALECKSADYGRFAYAILAADELVAVSSTLKFTYNDGTTYLNWKIGQSVDNAVWILLFLVLVATINMFPVKVGAHKSLNYLFRLLIPSNRYLESSSMYLEPSS